MGFPFHHGPATRLASPAGSGHQPDSEKEEIRRFGGGRGSNPRWLTHDKERHSMVVRREGKEMALKIIRNEDVWNLHTHSKYSAGDALPTVADIVATAKSFGQQAIGLTDHGNMAGSVQLYKHAMKAGLKPFPGTELYVVRDREDGRAKRHHMCVVAYNTTGYQNLVHLNSRANYNFHYKPLVDFRDLAQWSEDGLLDGIAGTSGCFFGYIAQAVSTGNDDEARRLIKYMDSLFPRFYVELQNHYIVHDEDLGITDAMIANSLLAIANEAGVPCVMTQDSHYAHPEDKVDHETMKRLVAWGDQPDDAVFPGDGFHLANDKWFRSHHDEKRYNAGMEGLRDLFDAHDLTIRELDSYHYNIPFTVSDPDATLARKTTSALKDMAGLPKVYEQRLKDELEIVHDTGMAGYLLLVASVTDWCQTNHVFYQARGSASGSIICWLLGITQIDPLKYDLRFERFISRDRMKPPDIDLDVERNRRDELLDWLRKNYAVCQIGTWMEMGLNEEGSGGLLRKYYAQYNKRNPKKIHEWSEVPDEDKKSLRALDRFRPFQSHGTHAAGVIVTSTFEEFDKLVPVMRVGDKKNARYVSQYEMDDIEALGLVKLDVLGLATLEVLHKCMDNLGRNIEDGLSWIPLSDKSTYAMISKGQTDGVFQLEGGAARRGVRELKPSKLDDIIASMALFRPATMGNGSTDAYINRKHKLEPIPERAPIIQRHTLKTYGILIYQEQIIAILREFGMSPDDLTAFLKAVKASNASIGDAAKVIEGYREQVRQMAREHGVVGDEWEWLWEAIEGFSAYGFNKAHASAYGLTAYRCAYLVNHHPTEFFAAVLSVWAGSQKEAEYIRAARRVGIKFRRPTINKSGLSYTVVRDMTIMKAMNSVDGVAESTVQKVLNARPKDGFTSIKHFAECMGTSFSGVRNFMNSGETDSGILGKMVAGGLFDGMDEE